MKDSQDLRQLLDGIRSGDAAVRSVCLDFAVIELLYDLIARREAEEAAATEREAEALRAQVFAERVGSRWVHGSPDPNARVTLIHKPTGRTVCAPTEREALDTLIGLPRHDGYDLSPTRQDTPR